MTTSLILSDDLQFESETRYIILILIEFLYVIYKDYETTDYFFMLWYLKSYRYELLAIWKETIEEIVAGTA